MSVELEVARRVKSAGVTGAWICRKTGIAKGLLYPSLQGRRELRADEFLSICAVLNLDPKEIANRGSA